MVFKFPFLKKLLNRLPHLSKSKEIEASPEEADGRAEPAAKAAASAPSAPPPRDLGLVDLDPDHSLYALYSLRRRQSSCPVSQPYVRLDADVFEPNVLERERDRLKKALTAASNARLSKTVPKKVKEGEEPPPPPLLDALPWVYISNDKLSAWLLVCPPVGEGRELDRELLDNALRENGVIFGMDEDLLDRLPQDKERYFKLFCIARGRAAIDGENGKVIERFARKVEKHFQVDEYDRVDYTNLNLVQNVGQGDEICALVPPTQGQPGMNVLGQDLPAKDGRKAQLPKGRNTEISEDGLSLIASQAGNVEYTGRTYQVKPVMEIYGDVDYSTGNINFLGDVHIQGDVCSGFLVRAMGNVHIDGVVSGGSVEAGGDLVVAKGILGGEQTTIRVHRNIFAKYLENCRVYVRENLQTDCIINSEIYSDGTVEVNSGRGTIMGGRVWAARKVIAKIVGSRSEVVTQITLGGLPCSDSEREELLQQLTRQEEDLKRIELQPESPGKAGRITRARMKLSGDRMRLEQLERDLEKLRDSVKKQGSGRMECGIVYPGTEITIGEAMLRVRHETQQCIAALIAGEVHLT